MPTIANAALRSFGVAGNVERNVFRSVVADTCSSRRSVLSIFANLIWPNEFPSHGSGFWARTMEKPTATQPKVTVYLILLGTRTGDRVRCALLDGAIMPSSRYGFQV
jgi:hypothetical protein